MRTRFLIVPVVAALLAAADAPRTGPEEGFVSIFDGKSLDGWRSANEPGHASGCGWSVRDGSIAGTQDYAGAWGILGTAAKYGDFELRLAVRADAPFDSGILVRATMEGHGYLVSVRPGADGDVGGISSLRIPAGRAPAAGWKKAWKEGEWNELSVVVAGQPPTISTRLNGEPMAELQVPATDPRSGPTGHVAVKLAGPAPCFNDWLLVRDVRIRNLDASEAKR